MIYVIDTASCIGALRRAKEMLDEEWENYICLALADVGREDHRLTGSCALLADYVGERCRPTNYDSSNLEDWLRDEVNLTESLRYETYTLCRMAWIDRMIEELTTKGALP